MDIHKKVLSLNQVSIARNLAREAFCKAREYDNSDQYYMASTYQLMWVHCLMMASIIRGSAHYLPSVYQKSHQKALEAKKQTALIVGGKGKIGGSTRMSVPSTPNFYRRCEDD